MLDNWKLETAAHAAHEANRAYCKSLGDNSQVEWDQAPEWQKVSARQGVLNIFNNPAMTSEQSHQGWLDHKIAGGWKYGPVKDAEKKEHPCIVEYAQLPHEQQAKDRLFTEVVKAVFAALLTHPQ